jgi:hypothetical protein
LIPVPEGEFVSTTITEPTLKDVQCLADQPTGFGLIVSCYADTSVAAGTRPLWHEHLKNEVRRMDGLLGNDPAARVLFHRNIAAVEEVLSARSVAAQGMAVFAAVQRGLVQGFALPVPVANRLVVDEERYVVPLLELLSRQRRYLVVHTDTHRGRLYTAVSGTVRLIEAIDEDVPKRQRAAGETWGKQQATIDRHRKAHILHYYKELIQEVERAWPEERYDGLVLLGEHEVTEQVRRRLPDRLARQVIAARPHAFEATQVDLASKIAAIEREAAEALDRRLIDIVRRRLLEQHEIAAGPGAVAEALGQGRIAFGGRLVMEPDRGELAWRCRGCRTIFVENTARCPACGGACERTNLWQALALLAAERHVPVDFIAPGLGLEKQGGIVAFLTAGNETIESKPAMNARSMPTMEHHE